MKKRNGTIEFLRFLFAICILIFHIGKYVLGEPSLENGVHLALFPHGALGVEFFFLISGYLLASNVYQKKENEEENLSDSTYNYMNKKVKSLLFFHIVAYLLIIVVTVIKNRLGLAGTGKLLFDNIPGLFFLQIVINMPSLNHIEWYISVLLFSSAIIYPLVKKYKNNFVRIVCPILGILLIGIIYNSTKSLTDVMKFNGIFYKSLIRGFSEMLIGVYLYSVVEKIKNKYYNKSKKILFTILEVLLYSFVIFIVLFTVKKKYEIYALFALIVAIPLSFSNVTYLNKIFDNKLSLYLGKLSLPIYLVQLSAIEIGNILFKNNLVLIDIVITIILAILLLKLNDLYLVIKKSFLHKRSNKLKN